MNEWECWDCGTTFATESPTCPKCNVELHVFEAQCDCIMCCPNGHCECVDCDEPCPEDCLIDLGIMAPTGAWWDEDSDPWRGDR